MAQRLAVVSGASSGIGAATARLLAAGGWRVVLVARRADRLEAVAERIGQVAAGEAVVEPLDAADPAAVAAMAARVRTRFGPPGAVVNSAGAGEWWWPEDTPPAEMERMLDAPYRAAYHLTHAFLGDLIDQQAGVLVHVGSPAAIAPWPSATAYTVSRWALRGLHEALRQDLHGTGVHSSHVVFGQVTSEYFVTNPGAREHVPRLARLIPVIAPEEAAQVIVRTVHAPRPQVLHPRALKLLAGCDRLAPTVVRGLARATGRRR